MTKTVDLISPIDGSVYLTREVLTRDAAFDAAKRARAAQADWAARPLSERIELVRKAGEIVGQQKDRMATELAHQMGRPVRYGGEYGGFNERLTYMADVAEESLAPMQFEDSDAFRRLIKRTPWGTVLVIAPWNYPYMTAINTVAPALIAGNTVILKHAGQTLAVGDHLAEAFHAAGVPEDVFQNLVLDHDTTSALLSERAVDFVNFTGSVGGGQAIERAAAGTFIPVSTELGGKDPGYVREDANLDAAVDTLLDGAMFNSGQCCCGIERIYVHESLYDQFVEKAVAWVNAQKLGNPLDPDTTMGPMANVRFAKEVRAQIEEALADGAKAHIDTMPADDGGAYLTPQILTNVTHKMRVMRDESFGPVVGIMPVKDDEEAIALMNDSRFGLTASIWSTDTATAEAIGDRIETGTVFLNRCDYLDPALCWTGCKDTGRGQGLSKLAYQALTRPKSYHLKKA
ncbi:MAG: aldehyde dehydrogenase family protein [Marivita sp.]|uniref:aldehyde dehydrogenase family protein n=1 Tax=Marivita sp. TaxID=2003365 RepID=UPI0025C0ADCE|nr:aldehyde dehydrogenase family protein [Marivita sp.]MCI5110510.1 aldehyde dehydrogenase family protein [Marivita sp.]